MITLDLPSINTRAASPLEVARLYEVELDDNGRHRCPCCGNLSEYQEDSVPNTETYLCMNPQCNFEITNRTSGIGPIGAETAVVPINTLLLPVDSRDSRNSAILLADLSDGHQVPLDFQRFWQKAYRGLSDPIPGVTVQTWCAIITPDPTYPHGLNRVFLDKCKGPEYLFFTEGKGNENNPPYSLEEGMALEFGADVWSVRGGKRQSRLTICRRYAAIATLSYDEILLRLYASGNYACGMAEAIKQANTKFVNPPAKNRDTISLERIYAQ